MKFKRKRSSTLLKREQNYNDLIMKTCSTPEEIVVTGENKQCSSRPPTTEHFVLTEEQTPTERYADSEYSEASLKPVNITSAKKQPRMDQ